MKTISFGAIKGGTGKSTTLTLVSRATAKWLSEYYNQEEYSNEQKKKVLVIDLDVNASVSAAFMPKEIRDIDPMGVKNAAAALLDDDDGNLLKYIVKSNYNGIDLIRTNDNLRRINFTSQQLLNKIRESNLAEYYDFIFIDTPATYNTLHIMAYTASDRIVTPINYCKFDVTPLRQLQTFLKKDTNKGDSIWKCFFSRVRNAESLSQEEYKNFFQEKSHIEQNHFLSSIIPDTLKVRDAIDRHYFISKGKIYAPLRTAVLSLASEITNQDVKELQGAF